MFRNSLFTICLSLVHDVFDMSKSTSTYCWSHLLTNSGNLVAHLICELNLLQKVSSKVRTRKLSAMLQLVVRRVPEEDIEKNMPKCLGKFSSTTSVLDCTEKINKKPKCLKCRLKFYSYYKGDLTVKFMTEVTSAGIIVESFGWRASDKCIFNHTDILQHLKSTRSSVYLKNIPANKEVGNFKS